MLTLVVIIGVAFSCVPSQVLGTGQLYAVTCGSLYAQDMYGDCVIILHADATTSATISWNGGNTILDVVPGQDSSYNLDGSYSVIEGIEDKVVYVSSDQDIEVHVSNEGSYASVVDALEAQTVTETDIEHYIINYGDGTNSCPGYTAFYTVAALEDATQVYIYVRGEDGSLELQNEFTLNQFQCYSERSYISGTEPNFSGYVVRSSKPTAAYSGNRCTREGDYYHVTWSSIPSSANLGLNHVTYPLIPDASISDSHYGIKVVATQDNTVVSTSNDAQSTTIQAAEVASWLYSEEGHIGVIECSNPCVVLQMVSGLAQECGVSQTIVIPTERMIRYGVFTTPNLFRASLTSYLHIIHSSGTGQGMFFDGISLDDYEWVPHAGSYSYVSFEITEGTHEVWSDTELFSAMVSGIGNTDNGYMFNVDTGLEGVSVPDTDPRPQKKIPLDGSFESASGEDFNLNCTRDYDAALKANVEEMAATVNGMIGETLCVDNDLSDMQVVTFTSSFTPEDNTGTSRITYYLIVGLDQTETEAEACAAEISDWLIPHENWAEILPILPGCPEVVFVEDQWTHTNNDWVCFNAGTNDLPGGQNSKSDVRVTSLSYDLTMEGRFSTDTGEDLSSQCVQIYTQDLLASTITQSNTVNAMLGSELCSGLNIQLGIPTVRLNAVGPVGETHQDYPFILSALSEDTHLREVSDCASEVSAYLAPHSNWQQPIIPTDPACPGIVFVDDEFLEESQQWVCLEE